MLKKRSIPFFVILFASIPWLLLSACELEEDVAPGPVTMAWGIPEEVTAFEGLQREPQGVEVEYKNDAILEVVWEAGESYILPITATSGEALTGVRYRGSNIPDHLELEWLEPREEHWYPIEEIPLDRVKAVIEQDNNYLLVDFGPPEGADFDEGMNRFIWFRITPTVTGEFKFEIFGYQMEEDDPAEARVSNILELEAVVEGGTD